MASSAIAVIDWESGRGHIARTGGAFAHTAPRRATVRELAEYAKFHGIRSVWLQSLDVQADWWLPGSAYVLPSMPKGAAVASAARLQTASGEYLYLHDCRDARWPFAADEDTQRLSLALMCAEIGLDVPLVLSPGATASALLRRSVVARRQWWGDVTAYGLPRTLAPSVSWAYPASTRNKARFVLLDANAAHLAAAQSVACGVGAPSLLDDMAAQGAYNANTPGIYQVTASGAVLSRSGWYDIAALRAAAAVSQPFRIEAARIWPAHHATLRGFSRQIAAARVRADNTAQPLAKAIVKEVYVSACGRLDMVPAKPHALYQPYWYAAIVAEAARRRWVDIARWHKAGGDVLPCYLSADMVGVLVGEHWALEHSGINVGPIGGYKVAGDYALADCPGLVEALAQSGAAVTAAVRALRNKKAVQVGRRVSTVSDDGIASVPHDDSAAV